MAKQSRSCRDSTQFSQKTEDLFNNFLINGVKLTGIVTSFDNFCVLLRRDGRSQLI